MTKKSFELEPKRLYGYRGFNELRGWDQSYAWKLDQKGVLPPPDGKDPNTNRKLWFGKTILQHFGVDVL